MASKISDLTSATWADLSDTDEVVFARADTTNYRVAKSEIRGTIANRSIGFSNIYYTTLAEQMLYNAVISPSVPQSIPNEVLTPLKYDTFFSSASRIVNDGVLDGTTTITSATANFTSDDVGSALMAAGLNNTVTIDFPPRIAQVIDSQTAILNQAAIDTATGVTFEINRFFALHNDASGFSAFYIMRPGEYILDLNAGFDAASTVGWRVARSQWADQATAFLEVGATDAQPAEFVAATGTMRCPAQIIYVADDAYPVYVVLDAWQNSGGPIDSSGYALLYPVLVNDPD